MNTQIIRPPAFQRPSGKLILSTGQSNLVDGLVTDVLLDEIPVEYKDGIENTGTHRITPGRAGWYAIVGHVQFVAVIANKSYRILIDSSPGYLAQHEVHASYVYMISAYCVLPCEYLSANQWVGLCAKSNAGVDTVDISTMLTYLSIQRVR